MKVYSFLLLLALSGCAIAQPSEAPQEQTYSIVDITGVGKSGVYSWQGKDWSVSDLEVALIEQDKKSPISEIRLLKGTGTNIMQTIEVAGLAEAVGAKALYETKDNGFKSINMVK